MWSPGGEVGPNRELLATTGDYLRIWEIKEGSQSGNKGVDEKGRSKAECKMSQLLNNNKNSEYCAPLTSFDWNSTDPSIIGTSSIDTTCT